MTAHPKPKATAKPKPKSLKPLKPESEAPVAAGGTGLRGRHSGAAPFLRGALQQTAGQH